MTQILILIDNFYLENLNNLTMKVKTIITTSFTSFSYLIACLSNFACETLIIISIIYLTSRAQKVLDTTSKIVTITAGSTVIYNNLVRGESSGSGSNDKDEDKKDNEDKNIKDENKEDKAKDLNNEK
jgi:hypothetical protein